MRAREETSQPLIYSRPLEVGVCSALMTWEGLHHRHKGAFGERPHTLMGDASMDGVIPPRQAGSNPFGSA